LFSLRRKWHSAIEKYEAREHWSKLEVEDTPERLAAQKALLAKRYPIGAFNKARSELDPHSILCSSEINTLFG
jgi:L-galactono-1,4-lactone dehydrogenase